MKFNFKKISAIATSVLMIGMSAGIAAAANYPAPFVSNGVADVAIIYGSDASVLDVLEASNIQANLQSYLTGSTGGTGTSTSGETVPLDSANTRIYLNTSLNTYRQSLTKTELPTVLGESTFSGNVEAKTTYTIKLQSGEQSSIASGGDASGKVTFERQPTTNEDPKIGISLGNGTKNNVLYNASVVFNKAVNFTHADSEGEEITLFGQDFTVASSTDTTYLVLLKEAEKLTLSLGGDSPVPSVIVNIGGSEYTIEATGISDTAATIKVTNSAGTSDSKEISEAASKKVNGVDIAITTADESANPDIASVVNLIVGAEKITIQNGAQVTTGDSNDPIDGTKAYIVGGTGATTELAIGVYRPDGSTDAILANESFVDPVFGSFKFDFVGLSSPLSDIDREEFRIGASEATMTLEMTNDDGYTKTFDWAHNQSTQTFLGDSGNNTINVVESANLTENEYVILGNEETGQLLQVDYIYNSSSSTVSDDQVRFKDVFTGETKTATIGSTEGSATLDVGAKQYTIIYTGPDGGSGSGGYLTIKYPTTDSANQSSFVVFPTLQTKNGALVQFYQPTILNLTDMANNATGVNASILNFPDGDGYTAVGVNFTVDENMGTVWYVGANKLNLTQHNATHGVDSVNVTIGRLVYNISSWNPGGATYNNDTVNVSLIAPEPGGSAINSPALVIFSGQETVSGSTQYEAIVVDLEDDPAGNSNNPIGVNDVLFTSSAHYEQALYSDSDITQHMDRWGTLVTTDANTASKKIANLTYPASQAYAQIYVGEDTSAVSSSTTPSGTTQLGEVIVKDSEISSVSDKNLVIVGGSCVNSAAATLVGGSYCGTDWTDATSIGSGQFIIKGYATSTLTSKLAVLVAGYNVEDTVNAARFLRNKLPDTDKEWKGTSETSADLVTTEGNSTG